MKEIIKVMTKPASGWASLLALSGFLFKEKRVPKIFGAWPSRAR